MYCVGVRLSTFSQLSITRYMGLCVFSLPISVVTIERIYMLQVGFGVKNDQHLSWGVYGVYSSIKIALKRYKDILQIQLKYNKMHSHSTLPTRSFIHSFTRSFIHSFIHSFIPITQHTTHASSMHHPFITHCIILCITHSSHCISTHHTSKTLYTTNHTDT